MRTTIFFLVSAFLSVTLASSFAPAVAAPPNRMTGQDWATRGYSKAAKEKKMKGMHQNGMQKSGMQKTKTQ